MTRLRWAICGALLSFLGCDSGPERIEEVPPERRVAFTAVYAETRPDGAPIQRVIVADFENPSVFRVLTPNDHASLQPRLSHDRQRVLFGDETIGGVDAPRLVLHNLETNRADTLTTQTPSGLRLSFLQWPGELVWDHDNSGFFLGTGGNLWRYAGGLLNQISERSYGWPWSLKGRDMLIVESMDPAAPGRDGETGPGYYFMSRDGRYLSRIRNPYLDWRRNGSGQWMPQAFFPSFSEEEERFAFVIDASNLAGGPALRYSGTRIAVTNLDGSFFRIYTTGEYYDTWPRWGPRGTILFDRVRKNGDPWQTHKVMRLDLKSGNVREFVSPSTFGAVGLRFPDAGPH